MQEIIQYLYKNEETVCIKPKDITIENIIKTFNVAPTIATKAYRTWRQSYATHLNYHESNLKIKEQRKHKKWTEKDMEYLKENYNSKSMNDLAQALNRQPEYISRKACSMGIAHRRKKK